MAMTATPGSTQAADASMQILAQLQESFGSVLVAAGKRGTEEKPTGTPQDRLPKVGRGSVALGGQGKGFQGKGGRRRPGKNQNGRPQSDSGNSSFLSGSTTDGEDAELLHLADHISLRVTLLWGIFTTLKEKLSHLSQEQLAYAHRASWIDTSSNWNFQRWESLATLLRVINGDTLTRFAATKGISADTQGTVLFQADISLRAQGSEELYTELARLQGSAIFQTIGIQFRPEGYKRVFDGGWEARDVRSANTRFWPPSAIKVGTGSISLMQGSTGKSWRSECVKLRDCMLPEFTTYTYTYTYFTTTTITFTSPLHRLVLHHIASIGQDLDRLGSLVCYGFQGGSISLSATATVSWLGWVDAPLDDSRLLPSDSTLAPLATETVLTVGESSDEDAAAHDLPTRSEPSQPLQPTPPQMIAQAGVTQPASTSSDADWGDVWNMDGATQYYHLRLLTDNLPPLVTRESPMIEQLSCLICSRGGCDASQLAQLCRLLPEQKTAKRRRATVTDGDTGLHQCTFSVGAFAIGGCIGVQRNTYDFPWTTLCLTSLINQVCPTHKYSSCSLLKNTMHFMHRDSGNAPHTLNLVLPLSRWQGGQIWLADEGGSIRLDPSTGLGRLLNVSLPYVTFPPHTAQATYPWRNGDRIVLIGYHARGLERLTREQRDYLQQAGFNLV
ncbi:hypothetical protein AK812_SmicGene35698 [Symbiodinium microadriaticum]|uniref:Uncharacterized protein n=1 Tax=Symbiodinium microadriaticum TaxID=2951 RepID=A0A1Q9CKZ5_SYMMI|nr:hypothetical protein AK812_SmicGene35698 [Symbiodinium microadriaticum]